MNSCKCNAEVIECKVRISLVSTFPPSPQSNDLLQEERRVRYTRQLETLSLIISYNKVSRDIRRFFRTLLQIFVPKKANTRQTLTCVFKNKKQFAGLLT